MTEAPHDTSLPEDYNESFYAQQLTPEEYREIGLFDRILFDRFHPSSVLDVGAGLGAHLRHFQDAGVTKLTAVESPHMLRTVGMSALPPGISYEFMDLRLPVKHPFVSGWDSHDMILCIEVAEHLPLYAAQSLALILAQLKGRLVWTAAQPGQVGTCHINCQPRDFWLGKFLAWGRKLDIEATNQVAEAWLDRAMSSGKVGLGFLNLNLLIFHPLEVP